MTAPVFLVGSAQLADDPITLDGAEARHAVAARRLRAGESVVLTDGAGSAAECEVMSVGRSTLVAAVRDRRFEPLPAPRLVVVQAIPKGQHADLAVDLLTQVGVDVITPWAAERAVVKWSDARRDKALQRWCSTAVAAAKQSRRLRFPEVTDPLSTEEVAALMRSAATALVLHESGDTPLGAADVPLEGDCVIVVGPEGGMTDAEVAQLAASGGNLVRLGPSVLRSSSAGAAAAAVLLSRTPRWS